LILNIAQSHIKLGNFPQAVTCCTEVLISEPRHYKALYKRATCYFEIEKIEEALKDIKLAYEVDPTNR
jgi:tetratricopeptide (TPR) repeat protein